MVHQYKLNGYNIVLDTASGSVHAVDEVAYDIIEMYKTSTPEEITAVITKKYDGITSDDVLECIDDNICSGELAPQRTEVIPLRLSIHAKAICGKLCPRC